MKSILYLVISFVLTFSILGPSFFELYTSDMDQIAFVETSEEEQQKKTGSEIEDIKIFEKNLSALRDLNNQDYKSLSNYNQNISSSDYLEIRLPPPRYSV